MRIAFYTPRLNHLKIIAPIATAARRRGHWTLGVAVRSGPKDDATMHALMASRVFDGVSEHVSNEAWVVAVGLRTAAALRQRTRPRLKWAALDHCGDNLSGFLEDAAATDNWDATFTLAQEPVTFATHLAAFDCLTRPVGYPELDQLHTVIGDKAACRAKWKLPAERFVVILGSAARPIGLSRLRRWWFGQYRYRAILRELRQWARAPRAMLIAKTRVKHGDPPWLFHYCERIIGDPSFYPFATLELLRSADLYVGFASAMAIEACAVGIPSVHLYGWPPEAAEWPSGQPFKQEFFMKEGGLWNCPGSRPMPCYGEDWRARLHDRIDQVLQERSLAGPGGMRTACERWAGPLDGQASARVLDALESGR